MYGILISLGILSSILVAEYIVKKDKKNTEMIWDIAFIAIVSGIIGARVYHVIDFWEYYIADPIKMIKIWEGGLGIYGGLILGFICVYIYLYNRLNNRNYQSNYQKPINIKEEIIYFISIITIVLPLGQAIGRWGNYFNKELYGLITTLPWGIKIDALDPNKYHPLFLYESLMNFILFIILITYKFKRSNHTITGGINTSTYITNLKTSQTLIGIYLGGYGVIRFAMEYLRQEKDILMLGNINIAQLISILMIMISYILISKNRSAL